MGSRLVDVGKSIGVNDADLKEMKRQRRRDFLTRIGQAAMPLASIIIGIYAADTAYPRHQELADGSYPFIPLVLASSSRTYFRRRSWTGPILVSIGLFIAAFAFVALFNTAANDNYGITTKYGVFDGGAGDE